MTYELEGKVALVTAAAGRGIGSTIARRLAEAGAVVVVTDSHERRTQEMAQAIGADNPHTTVIGLTLDVGDRQAIDDVVGAVEQRLGPVQILVNNAAVNIVRSIFESDSALWDWIISVNLTSAWELARRTMPGMRDAGGGVILNISSFAPDIGGEGFETPYTVSKGGLNTLSRCLAHEGGPFDIRCNTLSVGVIPGTKYVDEHPEVIESVLPRSPLKRLPELVDVAEAALFLVSDRSRNITGEVVNLAAGAYMRN